MDVSGAGGKLHLYFCVLCACSCTRAHGRTRLSACITGRSILHTHTVTGPIYCVNNYSA